MKNYPQKSNNQLNLIQFKNNLFGTKKSFFQFSSLYKQVSYSIQSDVKGVVQVLQKYSFTKSLSVFIIQGILSNFLKIIDLMLKREQFCNNLFCQIQTSILQGKPTILNQNNSISYLCQSCNSSLQKQNIKNIKQQILLGGNKIKKFLQQSLQECQGDDQSNNCLEYDLLANVKRLNKKVKKQITFNTDMVSEQAMKWNLTELQNNLQKRKYDILSCLIQMGQFGLQTKKTAQQMEKMMQTHKNKFQQLPKTIQQRLNAQFGKDKNKTKIPPIFDYRNFAFDIGKHFKKQIRQLQRQIQKIKKNYDKFMFHKSQHYKSQETQCNTIKDTYQKQLQKYKRKTDRQLVNQNVTIKQLIQENKKIKDKINQYENVVKIYISSKLEEQKDQLQKIKMELRIPKLIEKYQNKLKQQQNQINSLKSKLSNSKQQLFKNNRSSLQNVLYSFQEQNKRSEFSKISQSLQRQSKQSVISNKENIGNSLRTNNRKKKLNYLKSFLKRISYQVFKPFENIQLSNQQQISSSNQLSTSLHSRKLSVSQEQAYDRMVQQFLDENNSNQNIPSQSELSNLNNLKIISNTVQQQIQPINALIPKVNFIETSIPIQKPQLQNIKQVTYKNSKKSKTKLFKVKSQTDNKSYQKEQFSQLKQLSKKEENKKYKFQKYNHQSIKRYVSQHNTSKNQENQKVARVLKDENEMAYQRKEQVKSKRSRTNQDIYKQNLNKKQNCSLNKNKSVKLLSEQSKESTKKQFKKLKKVQSVTFDKKPLQDTSQQKPTLKLPFISQHAYPLNKTQNIKNLQKIFMNKSTLLTKKKRTKRNGSQQSLINSVNMFQKTSLQRSLGNKLDSVGGGLKNKKQYIIDFIPKIQQEQVYKKTQDEYLKTIQFNSIQNLFKALQQTNKSVKRLHDTKSKHKTKIIMVKNGKQLQTLVKLDGEGILLSTKIYSILASIKALSVKTYDQIISKIKNCFYSKSGMNFKNNCDQIITQTTKEKSVDKLNQLDHLPLSLQKHQKSPKNTSKRENQNNLQSKKQRQKHKVGGSLLLQELIQKQQNEINQKEDYNHKNKNRNLSNSSQFVQRNCSKQKQEYQMRKIISHIIFKHNQTCHNYKNPTQLQNKNYRTNENNSKSVQNLHYETNQQTLEQNKFRLLKPLNYQNIMLDCTRSPLKKSQQNINSNRQNILKQLNDLKSQVYQGELKLNKSTEIEQNSNQNINPNKKSQTNFRLCSHLQFFIEQLMLVKQRLKQMKSH